jgi:hypothetical protein
VAELDLLVHFRSEKLNSWCRLTRGGFSKATPCQFQPPLTSVLHCHEPVDAAAEVAFAAKRVVLPMYQLRLNVSCRRDFPNVECTRVQCMRVQRSQLAINGMRRPPPSVKAGLRRGKNEGELQSEGALRAHTRKVSSSLAVRRQIIKFRQMESVRNPMRFCRKPY